MLNVRNRRLRNLCLALILPFVVVSCGESQEEKMAKEMLAQATVCFNEGQYEQALEIVDTIPVMFPKQIKVRKAALDLKPAIIELATDQAINQCEQDIEKIQQEFLSAREKMQRIENPELVEGYWLPSALKGSGFMSTTGIQPRVNDDGSFNIISEVNNAGNLHHSSFSLRASNGDEAVSGSVPFDNELNYRINNSETVTYAEEKVDTVGKFAMSHYGEKMQLTFHGEAGKSKSVTLSGNEVSAIADAYNMATLQKKGKKLVAQKQLLERKLELARQQKLRNRTDLNK